MVKIPGSDFGYILFEYKSLPLAFRYPGIGSPSSVLCLEQSAFLGADTFLTFGSAGALEPDIRYRDIIIPPYAISDEGTSRHYGMKGNRADADPFIYGKICKYLQNQRVSLHEGPCWTTDTPYRETFDKIDAHRKSGCIAVEMECSALFAASAFLEKKLGSFLVAIDGFAEGRWISRLRSGQNNKINPESLFGFACEIALSLAKQSWWEFNYR